MELSLEFLEAAIGQRTTVQLVGNHAGLRFRGIQVLCPDTAPLAGVIYACTDGARELPSWQARLLGRSAVIAAGDGCVVGQDVPALVFPTLRIDEAFNLVNEAFLHFGAWQERVYRKALEQPELDALMGMLDEVTPNPWYIADSSYRVLAARNAPEVEDISYIWRFLYRNRRLPLETVLAMEDMGKIEQMSTRKTAYTPTVEPFNIPFVSKAIDTPEGEVAHFYIIGVYTRLTQYEVEIADFFGDVLTRALARGESKLPAVGRFYDSFLSSLIAGEAFDNAHEVLRKIYADLGWSTADRLRLVVFGDSGTPESVSARQRLLTVEARCRARCFFHDGHVTALINVARLGRGDRGEYEKLAMQLRPLAREFRCNVGVSEGLAGLEGLKDLGKRYEQALFCLETADFGRDDEAGAEPSGDSRGPMFPFPSVVEFSSVAIRYFQAKVARAGGMEAFQHPALEALRDYDERNRTDLIGTLRTYLENDRNVTRTAALLFVHRNTLLKRMAKIASLTSLDLDDMACRQRLLLSLLLR